MYSKKLNMKDPIYSMPENALTIALSADHAGYELKTKLLKWLEEQGYQTLDLGTNSEESVDYPDYGAKLGDAISADKAQCGIGISIALNRFVQVRSALCRDVEDAKLARQHNNANVVSLGARKTPFKEACRIVATFLDTDFEGGRHERRVEKLGGCAK